MTLITDFDIAYEVDDSRSCFRHCFAPPYHPGSTDLLTVRIFLNALPQSSKSWFLEKSRLKGTGVVTNYFIYGYRLFFLKTFPDWSDPKRVRPYQVCGSRNTLCKSPMRLHTFYCDMTLITDFDIAYEVDDSRSCFRHCFAPPYHPGSTDLLTVRIFLNALPQSSKSWFLEKSRLKGTGVVTNYFIYGYRLFFLKTFPDWSDPKRVRPYQVCGSRNTLCKSPMRLHTFYWGWDLSGVLTLRICPPNHGFSGLKSVFDSISTIRSISISFLLILFMIGVDDRSFHEDLISKMCLFIVIYLIVTFKSQRVTYVESS